MNGTRVALDSNTILSGLLYRGNERELLTEGVAGRIALVVAEDTIEEVLYVMRERFANHPAFGEAIEWLERLLLAFELVARTAYRDRVTRAAELVRDPEDGPVLACALAAGVDSLVSGDRDLLVLKAVQGVRIRRTAEVLREIRRRT